MQPISARDALTIPEAVQSLRRQLLEAVDWATDEGLTFAIDSVEVELQMTVSLVTKGEARASLWTVVTAGGGVAHTDTQVHRVTLTLQPTLAPADDDPRVHIADAD